MSLLDPNPALAATPAAVVTEAESWPTVDAMLRLEQLDDTRFRSLYHQANRRRGLFGGQILGQAFMAAAGTVKAGRLPSELKILFLLPGTPGVPVTFRVETLLEGGSFSIRRVRCEQETRLIADVTASFHRIETGYEHQDAMPADIKPPEELDNFPALAQKYRDRLPPEAVESMTRSIPVELRPVDPETFLTRPSAKPELRYWMRASTSLPDDAMLHYGALAFISDWWFSGAGFMRHTELVVSNAFFVTSLNHTVWFHRQPRADEWLLFCAQSPAATAGRGLSLGRVWDRQGRYVASLAQDALGRQFKPRT